MKDKTCERSTRFGFPLPSTGNPLKKGNTSNKKLLFFSIFLRDPYIYTKNVILKIAYFSAAVGLRTFPRVNYFDPR